MRPTTPTSAPETTTTAPETTTSASEKTTTTTAPATTTTTAPATTTSGPETTTTAPETTTSAPETTTSNSESTTTTTPETTTSAEAAPATTSSSSSWAWIIAALLVAVAIALLIVLLMRRGRKRAEQAWREVAEGPLQSAKVAADSMPDAFVSDDVAWEAVHAQAEEAAASLEHSATDAPTATSRDASQDAAQALRSTYFAFESARLLRNAAQAPTPEQLAQADVLTRTSAEALNTALDNLEQLVHPERDDASGAAGGDAVGHDNCARRRSRAHPVRRSSPRPGRPSSFH